MFCVVSGMIWARWSTRPCAARTVSASTHLYPRCTAIWARLSPLWMDALYLKVGWGGFGGRIRVLWMLLWQSQCLWPNICTKSSGSVFREPWVQVPALEHMKFPLALSLCFLFWKMGVRRVPTFKGCYHNYRDNV
jgi:hypothetical protein